ncbi:hypothetical protein DL95DRAFT_459314 [Leptodontidium sp. 2 PMI_412]|nr:hypothetical protein DL95DRAFT_459314 [Leptodontidium sp. 2 PMI_412]
MTSQSPLETLPLLVLERICEYLDDESVTRRDLHAFSTTNKHCYAVSTAQLFSQIELKIRDPEELESSLQQWNSVLKHGRNRHVRRLKISWDLAKNESRISSRMEDEEFDDDGYPTGGWNVRPYFAMHSFCRPLESSMEGNGGGRIAGIDDPGLWASLGEFVRQFSVLRDLVWVAGCIIGRVGSFEFGGLLNYIGEALQFIVSGLAPNLVHMCEIPEETHGEMELTRAIMLGKPDWRGFFLGKAEIKEGGGGDQLSTRGGKLQTLISPSYVSRGIEHWAGLTHFSHLRCLVVPWGDDGIALATIASRGDLRSLIRLELSSIEDENEPSRTALQLFFSCLNPLQHLHLRGYISPETFNIIVLRHSENLRNLEIHLYSDDDELRNPLVKLSGPVMQHFAEHCPHLTHLSIPINRTRGDRHEYSIGPDEESWDEERDGEYPFTCSIEAEDIPFPYIREVYTNIAMEYTLALSIFNLISKNCSDTSTESLKRLKLSLDRKMGPQAPASFGDGTFQSTLRYFGRPWMCTRDERGEVVVKELEKERTDRCREKWRFLLYEDAEKQVWSKEMYPGWYKSIWPQETEELLNDWEGLPLDLDGDGDVWEES